MGTEVLINTIFCFDMLRDGRNAKKNYANTEIFITYLLRELKKAY